MPPKVSPGLLSRATCQPAKIGGARRVAGNHGFL